MAQKVELKTKVTDQSVDDFLASLENEDRREDCYRVLELLRDVTGVGPKMWGESIVGFGSYEYKYASGREGEWMVTGFSPRKSNLTIYILPGLLDEQEDILERLGKHTHSKSCLYLKKLDDVDSEVLRELVEDGIERLRQTEGCTVTSP